MIGMSKRIINDDDYYTRNITDQYLHDINKIPLLDENEFQKLFLEYKNGSEAAKNKILVSNLRLSLGVARKYIGLGVPLIDLVCEGNFGLEEALKRYDPEKGKYSTYAYSWIDRYIRNAVPNQSKMVRFPITAYDDFVKYRRFVEKYYSDNGKYPDDSVILENLDITKEALKRFCMFYGDSFSLDAPLKIGDVSADEVPLKSFIKDRDVNVEDEVFDKIISSALDEALSKIKPKYRELIKLRFGFNGEPMTLKAIAKEYGTSHSNIGFLLERCIRSMKKFQYSFCDVDDGKFISNPSLKEQKSFEIEYDDSFNSCETLIARKLFDEGYDITRVMKLDILSDYSEKDKLVVVNETIKKYVTVYKNGVSRSRK